MTGEVVEFARALRRAGVRVSLAETLDACECLRYVNVRIRAEFRLALRAALVKEPRDFSTFDTLFETHFRWHGLPRKRREPHQQTRRNEGTATGPARRGGDTPDHKTDADRPAMGQRSSPHAEEPPDGQQPRENARAEERSEKAADGREPRELSADDAGRRERLAALAEELREGMAEARREAGRQVVRQRDDLRQLDLKRRLSPEETREVAEEVEKLARKLVSRESLRLRRARRGRVDVKGTLARSARTGGIPFQVVRRQRAIARNNLLVLCDVSGSVWRVAAFLLQLVHRLQSRFSRTRSLVFVDRPVDVTGLFQRFPFADALARLRDQPDLNLNAYSDFGNAFYEVLDDYGTLIDRDTVILVLGDARTNQFDPMEWTLAEMRRLSRRVVWLNPEPRERWNTHDSAMARYAPFCDAVFPCANLEQLAEAAASLLR